MADDGMYEFQLAFTQIECPNCQAIRAASISCASCGLEAQSDPLVDRRSQLVQAANASLEAGRDEEGLEPLTLEHVWDLQSQLLDELMSSIQAAARDEDGAEEKLTLATNALCRFGRRLQETAKLRPWLTTWRTVETAFQGLLNVGTAYLGSLANPDPESALADGERAQQALDEAASELDDFNERAARLSTIEEEGTGDPVDNTALIASLAYARVGASDPREADSRGAHLFGRLDSSAQCPQGFGLSLAMSDITAENIMDAERFWRVARTTYERLKGSALLIQLAEDDAWRTDMEGAMNELNDAGLEAARMFAIPSPRVQVRAALSLGMSLTEITAKPLLATLLACRRAEPYAGNRQKDIGALLTEIQQAGLRDLTFGLDRAIRDADAHGLYRIQNGLISFESRRREYDQLSEEELGDRVIGALESVSAMVTGLNAAMLVGGVDSSRVPTAQFEPEGQITVLLAANGVRATGVKLGLHTTIHGSGPDPTLPLVIPTAVLPLLPIECETITIVLDTPTGVITIAAEASSLRRWTAAEGDLEKQFALVEAMRRGAVNQSPLLSSQQLRRWISATARDALGHPPTEALAVLRSLRDLARRTGEDEGAEAMTRLLRATREEIQGLGSAETVHAELADIEQWAERLMS